MAKYRQTSRKRPPKKRRSSRDLQGGGRLPKSTHRGWSLFDPRRDPDTSTLWEEVHYMHFTSYDIGSFMLPAKKTSHLLNPLNPKSDQHQISPCNINAL